jgi:hypothetical protein
LCIPELLVSTFRPHRSRRYTGQHGLCKAPWLSNNPLRQSGSLSEEDHFDLVAQGLETRQQAISHRRSGNIVQHPFRQLLCSAPSKKRCRPRNWRYLVLVLVYVTKIKQRTHWAWFKSGAPVRRIFVSNDVWRLDARYPNRGLNARGTGEIFAA